MDVPAIVLGDAQTVLRLDPAAMKNPSEWTQLDSDIIAHFLQYKDANGSWRRADELRKIYREKHEGVSMPVD